VQKIRLDVLLTEKGLAESRSQAQALILAGKISVNGQLMTKPGLQVFAEANITVKEEMPFVSRGGFKLADALQRFGLDPTGAVCADVGASTGGFTDVLLQHGAAKVYAIDVGYGQLAWKLRQDKRVIVLERTNARYLEALPESVHLVTIDVSFISIKLILPAVSQWLTLPGQVIALIKPQFEAGREQVGKGGVIREKSVHQQILEQTINAAIELSFDFLGLIPSPITGPAGNHEFLAYFGWHTSAPVAPVEDSILNCLAAIE
jgi:23S rRNA (cytidine1920-2'-O)/16S rRNA (cytidine1409-2'-O)-methyltransferase